MKKNNKARLSTALAIIIIVLGAVGFIRRCGTGNNDIVNEYVKPGGDTIAVAIEMSPLTYTMHNDTAEGFDYNMLRGYSREASCDNGFLSCSVARRCLSGAL